MQRCACCANCTINQTNPFCCLEACACVNVLPLEIQSRVFRRQFIVVSLLANPHAPRGCCPCLASATQAKRARLLATADAPPSTEEIAQFNIILFSSIALVLICYFAMMAMVNMVSFCPEQAPTPMAILSCSLLACATSGAAGRPSFDARPQCCPPLLLCFRISAATRCFIPSRSPIDPRDVCTIRVVTRAISSFLRQEAGWLRSFCTL